MKRVVIDKNTVRRNSDIMRYFNDVSGYKHPDAEEEYALFEKIADGDRKSFDDIICMHTSFVIAVAGKFQGNGAPLSDLISAGNVGLITAAGRFDHRRGVRFISYAVSWILRMIYEELRLSRTIKLPSGVVIENRRHRREHEGVNMPCVNDTTVVSLNASDEDDRELSEMVSDPNAAFDVLGFDNPNKAVVELMMLRLTERERTVLSRRYGIGGGECLTFREIAELPELRVSTERARQIHDKAIKKMYRFKDACRTWME